jgi:hypothetical protein
VDALRARLDPHHLAVETAAVTFEDDRRVLHKRMCSASLRKSQENTKNPAFPY